MTRDPWLQGSLPAGWTETNIGELCEVVRGGSPRPMGDPRYFGGPIPFIKIGDVTRSNGIVLYEAEASVTERGALKSRRIEAGRLILTNSGTICVPIFLGVDACIHDGFVAFERLPDFVDQKFLFYLFKYIRPYVMDKYKQGVTQVNLNTQIVEEIRLWLPPCREQRRIVARIEALFSEVDSGVESIKAALQQLKVYREAVLRDAFEGKLTTRAGRTRSRHWPKMTLGAQLTYLTSGSRGWAKYYADRGDKFIRAQNLKYDRLDLNDIAFVMLPEQSEGMRTRVQAGDLLITITGANVTKTAVVRSNIGTAYVSQHVALARPAKHVNSEFLYWFLVAEAAGRKQLKAAAYGAGKPGLNLDNIRLVELRMPPPNEQVEIVARIESLVSIADSVCLQLEAELAKASSLRQLILKRAFSGRLVTQDPHDEPAAVLLERIRTSEASGRDKKSLTAKEAA